VLGDLVNLVDYRTLEGIVPDVVGVDIVQQVVDLRTEMRFDDASALWAAQSKGRVEEIQTEVQVRMRREYEAVAAALAHFTAFVTYGNVDNVRLLRDSLPTSATFIDTGVVEIDGLRVGFAGGGVPAIGSAGEVSAVDMAAKLASLGPVDVLCTHVPPAIPMLSTDVVGGRPKGSEPVLEYVLEHQPGHLFFGDVHQPRAVTWRVGRTKCRNTGYFRATGRAFAFG
jgi:Icc-related predicted phosphoesterase